jgi:tetratricopeptide (TPR) repeat protein
MASTYPITRQIAWVSLIPQLIVMACLILLAGLLGLPHYFALGALVYLLLSGLLKRILSRHHRKGIALYKKGLFKEAITHYQNSYAFFIKHSWIDKYRYLTLLCSSRVSYIEMALLNIAHCYGQIDEAEESLKYYQLALQAYPNSEVAKMALRMFQAVRDTDQPKD